MAIIAHLLHYVRPTGILGSPVLLCRIFQKCVTSVFLRPSRLIRVDYFFGGLHMKLEDLHESHLPSFVSVVQAVEACGELFSLPCAHAQRVEASRSSTRGFRRTLDTFLSASVREFCILGDRSFGPALDYR